MWERDKLMLWLTYLLLGILSGLGLTFIFKNYNAIITFCNNNEGFFSALLGFLAILISVLTYYNQKKEQTKNAQENAKLQRELTEQNNKFQADLQLRQIRLDKYNITIDCCVQLNLFDVYIDDLIKAGIFGLISDKNYKEIGVLLKRINNYQIVKSEFLAKSYPATFLLTGKSKEEFDLCFGFFKCFFDACYEIENYLTDENYIISNEVLVNLRCSISLFKISLIQIILELEKKLYVFDVDIIEQKG